MPAGKLCVLLVDLDTPEPLVPLAMWQPFAGAEGIACLTMVDGTQRGGGSCKEEAAAGSICLNF